MSFVSNYNCILDFNRNHVSFVSFTNIVAGPVASLVARQQRLAFSCLLGPVAWRAQIGHDNDPADDNSTRTQKQSN